MDEMLRLGRPVRDPLGAETEDELALYKPASQAYAEDVVPRSRGISTPEIEPVRAPRGANRLYN